MPPERIARISVRLRVVRGWRCWCGPPRPNVASRRTGRGPRRGTLSTGSTATRLQACGRRCRGRCRTALGCQAIVHMGWGARSGGGGSPHRHRHREPSLRCAEGDAPPPGRTGEERGDDTQRTTTQQGGTQRRNKHDEGTHSGQCRKAHVEGQPFVRRNYGPSQAGKLRITQNVAKHRHHWREVVGSSKTVLYRTNSFG